MSHKLNKYSGIYCIENIETKKIYIGSSVNLRGRVYNHLWHLDNGSHANTHLQNSYNKHNGDNFIIFELERCEESILIQREQLYLDLFLYAVEYIRSDGKDERFHHYGYNLSPTAGKTIGFKHTDDEIEQMIIQGRLNWKNPKYRAAQETHYASNVIAMQQGKLDDPTYIERLSNSVRNSDYHKGIRKPVIVYNRITGEFVDEFESIKESSRKLNLSFDRILLVLKKKIKYTSTFYFEYKTSNIYPLKIEPIAQYDDMDKRREAMIEKVHNKNKIPVLAYKLSGEFIGEYESQSKVVEKLKTHPGSVLRGTCSQANGYVFKYKDPNYVSKKRKPYKISKKVATVNQNT